MPVKAGIHLDNKKMASRQPLRCLGNNAYAEFYIIGVLASLTSQRLRKSVWRSANH